MRARLSLLLMITAWLGCTRESGCEPTLPTSRGSGTPGELQRVELQLNWFPEAEHGGSFAALVHGYYEQAGLQVNIRSGGPSVPVLSLVASRQVTFGVVNADTVLLGWGQEARTIAVLAPLQHSPRCIMVHEKSDIRDWKQLEHLTLAMNDSSTFSLFLRSKLPLTEVRVVPYSGNVAQFLLHDDLAQQAYIFSEPYVARKQGGDPYCLMVSELGFDPYTSVLITHPRVVAEQPELVRTMVAATIRGWRKYLEDSGPTNRYIAQQNSAMELDILAYGAAQLRPLCLDADTPPQRLGRMTSQRWQTLAAQLVDTGALERDVVEPQAVFTTAFLEPSTDLPAK